MDEAQAKAGEPHNIGAILFFSWIWLTLKILTKRQKLQKEGIAFKQIKNKEGC